MDTVIAQWGYNQHGIGGFGNPPPYPPPNNNVGVGYPTAYGLWHGRGSNNNNGGSNQGSGLSSSVRCLNGGAHIGQCRLDNDAICTALGGGCIHGACCTTPFIGVMSSTTSGPEVDGEVCLRVVLLVVTYAVQYVVSFFQVTRKPKKHTAPPPSAEEDLEDKVATHHFKGYLSSTAQV
ncbi:hypothetical protein ANCDUO_11800 [Ancylostoma duodenale]|uniref:Uncharacterized protein n=1 Tax=Ancylostoma duodenale TaxID=51022 RepID=A0A0C2GGP9_9BILA|nr:hypothetical protein ANCDUO_11800 [Ancylostoma duodenale]